MKVLSIASVVSVSINVGEKGENSIMKCFLHVFNIRM